MFSSFVDGFIDTVKYVKDIVTEAVPKMIDAFKEWWDGFNLVDTILGAFNWLKDKVMFLFSGDNFSKGIDEILSWDIGGFIAEKIGGVANGITTFFKNLPANLVAALPDGFMKTSLQKLVGTPETPAAAAPATVAPQTSFAPNTSASAGDIAAAFPMNPNVTPSQNPTAMGVVAGTNNSALEASISTAAPIVINNNSSNSQPPVPPRVPRVSGAVSTAPAPSLLDRTLYGNGYGAGVP
jgi:hypothetical protein